jgi:hypothetical protein
VPTALRWVAVLPAAIAEYIAAVLVVTLAFAMAPEDSVYNLIGGAVNHVGRSAGSRAVVYEHDPQTIQGHQGAEAVRISVALHEIAHTWCCYGSGTFEGHWITSVPAPGLMNQYWFLDDNGLPEFGLVFSDRELIAMGLAR